MNHTTVILQLICPDRPGLVSEIAGWVYQKGGNIRHADHHTDDGASLFLSRIEWDLKGFAIKKEDIPKQVQSLANKLSGEAKVSFSDDKPKVAIFVSKQSHCLLDILWRAKSLELPMEIPLIISNHLDLEPICKQFSIPFKYINMKPGMKNESEKKILDLLISNNIEFVILAKFMQILSGNFLKKFSSVINIHHSFLPAFKGAQPYQRAWERGVKLIGATAHYVTEELDNGPIIEQTIAHISHRDEVTDLIRIGRDTERIALARAIRLHLKRQVIVYGSRTAVFS